LELLDGLTHDGVFARADDDRGPGSEQLERAAAHALRGLRAARISI
jgi:hypothetical protein